MPDFTFRDIAKMFDHSLLQPNLTDAEMEAGLQIAPGLQHRVGLHQALLCAAGPRRC